jgi:hypothetical protein
MRLLWLPQVLRGVGLTVHEVGGWRTRGSDTYGPVRGITCHHTAGSRNSSDEGEINVLVNGRPGLSGPIAQLYLSRTGDWWVVASGHCNHNKVGWGGPNEGFGNDSLLGIEAQHSGGDEPWTSKQYQSYVRGVAALVRHKADGYNVAVSRVAGHKEHQPGDKSDPTFNMSTFRSNVAALIAAGMEDDVTQEELEEAVRQGWAELLVEMTDDRATSQRGRLAAQRLEKMIVNPVITSFTKSLAAFDAVDEVALAQALAPALADAVLAKLPDSNDPVTKEELIEALTETFRQAFPQAEAPVE